MTTSADRRAGSSGPLPRLLARLRREARLWVWVDSLAMLALAIAGIFWATLAFDWLVEPPAWVRAVSLAAAAAGICRITATRLVGRLVAPLPDRALALCVERRQPWCGDALSTAVTLAENRGLGVDAELADHVTRQAAALAGRVSAGAVFRRGRLLVIAAAGMLAAGSVGGLLAARPAVAAIWGRRLLLLREESWPRQVRLEAAGFRERVRKVPRGGDVDLLVEATASGPLPEIVELRTRSADGPWQTVRMGTRGAATPHSRTFGHMLEAVTADLELEIRGGDARLRGLRLAVVDPPSLSSATIRCSLPGYLGGGLREPPASRVVAVPRGSRVEVTLAASKPLVAARLAARFAGDPDPLAADPSEPARLLASFSDADPPAATITAVIPTLDADCTLIATFTDTDGITNREPITLTLAATPDEPPQVNVRLDGISTAVTRSARLPIVGTLADDHGLAGAVASLTTDGGSLEVPLPQVRGGELLVEIAAPRPAVVPLQGLATKVGERVRVVVAARDGCGLPEGPQTSVGETWVLEVVTADALQALLEAREVLLRRRFEAMIEDLALVRGSLGQPAAADSAPAAGRLAEATARAGGETTEIETAFRGIRNEFANNELLTPELEGRLVAEIADPLAAAAEGPLARLAVACREASAGRLATADLAAETDTAIAALRSVLARMLELESFNQVVDKLRSVIDAQERLRRDTLERQRREARELLE